MLKYKCEDVVVYFCYENRDYRRIDSVWEILDNNKWVMVDDSSYFESAYKKRCKLKELIRSKDNLKKEIGMFSNNELNKKYSNVVHELMNIFGTMVLIDYTSEQLIRMIDEGKILLT